MVSSRSEADVEETASSSSWSSSLSNGCRASSSRSSSLDNLSEVFQLLSSTASSSTSSFSSFGSSSSKCACSEVEKYSVAGQNHDGMMQHKCVSTVTAGHVGLVSAMEAAGEYLYTASGGGLRVWRQLDLAPCGGRQMVEEGARVVLVAGEWVFAAGAGQDYGIQVWRRRRPSREVDGGPAMRHVASLPTARDRLLRSFSQSNYVQVRRHHKKLWIQHADVISALAISSDHDPSISSSNTSISKQKKMMKKEERLLFSASWDRTVKVWRLSDMRCVESIAAHRDAINALATSPSSPFLYTASCDGLIKAWSRSSSAADHARYKHTLVATRHHSSQATSSVNALAISPAGDFLYSAGSDGVIAVWKISSKDVDDDKHLSLACKLKGHRLPILCLYRTQSNLLLSGSADKTVRVWRRMDSCATEEDQGSDQMGWCCVAVLKGHRGPVKSICVAEDQLVGGCVAYTGSSDKSIKVWKQPRNPDTAPLSRCAPSSGIERCCSCDTSFIKHKTPMKTPHCAVQL